MGFFDFIALKYKDLDKQVNDYVKVMYSKSNESFSSASPYGQILNMLKEFFQGTVIYQKNIARNLDYDTVTNVKVARLYSLIAGNNPTRSICSTGTLKVSLKPSINIVDDIPGGSIIIKDKTLLRNNTNGLYYTVRFGRNTETFRMVDNVSFYMNIVQGKYEEQTFTGTGLKNQSFSVNIPSLSDIDNFDVEVLYNAKSLTKRESLYDMQRFEEAYWVRTGMNGGIDVFFGNGYSGFMPELGSIITVRYLLTDGNVGNILTPVENDFKFLTEITDINGGVLNIPNLFNIIIDGVVDFGSNGDSTVLLRNSISNVSRNFVLSTSEQYIYHLSRLGFFSKINVYNTLSDNDYTNDSMVYLFLIPKISNYYSTSVNYFNVPLSVYYLDSFEIDKIVTYLKKLGSIPNGTELEIIQPRISKYVMIVYVRKFDGYSDESIKTNIISSISDYLSFLNRDDRIVRSDIVSNIESVDGVDSLKVDFISEKNEILHKTKPSSTELVGLDPILGDIIVNKDELALIRGGWSDRNGTYYNESSNSSGLGPINIVFVGTTIK